MSAATALDLLTPHRPDVVFALKGCNPRLQKQCPFQAQHSTLLRTPRWHTDISNNACPAFTNPASRWSLAECSLQVLCVDPSVELSPALGTLQPEAVTTVIGAERPGRQCIHLTFLPDDSPTQTRLQSSVVSLPPDDPFWSVRTTEGLYAALSENFPQVLSWCHCTCQNGHACTSSCSQEASV